MTDAEKAAKVLDALNAAESQPANVALTTLNGLVNLAKGDQEQPLDVEEARIKVFLALCEVGKALHYGKPADHLWVLAIDATEQWVALAK